MTETIKPFILDNERILDSTTDLLKTSVYADNLISVINNVPKDKVFTIGLFGGWGTGKSSIIKTAQSKIEADNKNIKFITYDAWKYANDSFRRMFLLKVQQELRMQQTEMMSRFYQSETAEAEPKIRLSAKGLAIAMVVLAILSILLFLSPNISLEWSLAVPTVGTLGAFVIALLNGCFYDLKVTICKPTLFAPEQFEACFKEMMAKSLKQRNWVQRTWSKIIDYVSTGDMSIVNLDKLIIVIDNIDRCPSDMAYQLLTDIKTFLSNENYNVVFIVPVDDEALKKHLFNQWSKMDEKGVCKEKEEFLRKFFNVSLRIKPHQETELQHFSHEINKENQLGYSSDTLAIVSKEFADNPRRIIQLLNNLSGELTMYDEKFVAQYETVICAALIMREEYGDFYRIVTRDLNAVKNFDVETHKKEEPLLAFMRVAGLSFKKAPIDALQRIFTNTSSVFKDLPVELLHAVQTFDSQKIIDFVQDNVSLRENIVDYAFDSLKTDVKYGATNQTTQWIDFLSNLYKASFFGNSHFVELDNALSPYYKVALPFIAETDSLGCIGSRMNMAGVDNLRGAILEYLNDKENEKNSNYKTMLTAYLRYFSSEEDCNAIAYRVEEYYVDRVINKEIKYSDCQRKILFGDSFVAKQVENLPDLEDQKRIEDLIWCLEKNSDLSASVFAALFEKLVQLFGNTRGKTKEDYLAFISNLQPILSTIKTKSLTEEPLKLYEAITGERGVPHPSYPSQSSRDTQKSILEEVEGDEAKAVISFCYQMMRISDGHVNVSDSFELLFERERKALILATLDIQSIGVNISSIASTLLNADDYTDDDEIAVLKAVLSRQPNGMFMVTEESVKAKIHDLINHSNEPKAEKLLEDLSTDVQILSIITDYVASCNVNVINSLPISIAQHAISTFNKSNADAYKDNPNFLILVLQRGNATQENEVVRMMKQKLVNEEDLENVVLVLSHLDTRNQTLLQSVIVEIENVLANESIDEAVKDRINQLKKKLSASVKSSGSLKKILAKK